jgi:2-polyprenyl-3-methyl-5-hydroxy-6-metoxy-1,4-benzoquinol methylase
MKISELILYNLAKRWPSPIAEQKQELGLYPASDEYNLNYAMKKQFLRYIHSGFQYNFYQKRVLEIGCGHGGISTFFAVNGATEVVGIDLNTFHLEIANKFKKKIEKDLNIGSTGGLNLKFMEMSAYEMNFEPETFDIIVADNVFEHFMETDKVLEQSYKILKPGGMLVIPTFNSIYSKYGIHLKHALKMPWANLFFSEKTICNVVYKLGKENPFIWDAYGGLVNRPTKIKDIRKYGDLNSMTHARFHREVKDSGFQLQVFKIKPVSKSFIKEFFRLMFRYKWIQKSIISDVFSFNVEALLIKPKK